MQQVAAHKTDIAALPFSASSTAKAVETGIGTQQETSSENNQAFNRLYQEAKTSKADFVLNDNRAQRSQSRNVNRSDDTHASSPAPNETVKRGKDRDAGHTDLPVQDDLPVSKDKEDASAELTARRSNENRDESALSKNTHVSADEETTGLAVDDAAGNVEQKSVNDIEFIIGEGGKKDAQAGVIAAPGTPDEKSSINEREPDWVAYVETVANRLGKSEQSSDNFDAGMNNRISVVASDASSVMAHLLSQLDSENNKGEIAFESLSSDAQQTLSALTSLLLGESARKQQASDNSDANTQLSNVLAEMNAKSETITDSDNGLSALIAKLMQSESSSDAEQALSVEQARINEMEDASLLNGLPGNTGGTHAEDKASADESLVLSLLSDERKDMQILSLDEASSQASALLAEITAAAGSGDTSATATESNKITSSDKGLMTNTLSISESINAETIGEKAVDLLTAINELSPQSAQKATEAFAERVVAGIPNPSQQQAVKTNIIAGINEFQQQVQQGREPGIDLSAIVADAAKEAAVSTEVIASMTARLDSQASQFLNLMTQTQASAQQAFASMVGQTDTVMQENTQLRAEASKSQQQFEGFDKAVNIHKPEGQQQLNEKIRWMVNARNTMAEIRLDPPELGSMQVRVNVAGDAASVSFVVQSQQAKDALADAMPKLRDMLSEQGIELGDAQVRKDNSSGNENGQQLAQDDSRRNGAGNRGENDGLDDMEGTRIIEQSVTRAAKGGIDFYA
ncbi:hypothetical protein KUL156_22970 [Alteromonas sp. KUL156]|nr:hypothetical protein KUL154_55910 [Alteromonas sp. KUL154]GFD99704.1 hypothetical protein KUL156_22970 [Alteromonas sp. KUL156]